MGRTAKPYNCNAGGLKDDLARFPPATNTPGTLSCQPTWPAKRTMDRATDSVMTMESFFITTIIRMHTESKYYLSPRRAIW